MKRVGFLGCGKIGKSLAKHIMELENAELSFIQDLAFENDIHATCPIITQADESLYENTDLIIEGATASVLNAHLELILKHCDLMMFSVTAFSEIAFEEKALQLKNQYHHNIYIPHGAILGIDGIFDAHDIWSKVHIVTTKSPKSLGRSDEERTVLYDGPTRDVCSQYPRNVNVHACIALAGIGFDRTHSTIIADPAVDTNAHIITIKGDGIDITMDISSYANGAVTGAYTPYSACGSLDRILNTSKDLHFV
ncbi:MAG: aspartate dehydrogenase domain-containing protein [Eubacteriales bacterium]